MPLKRSDIYKRTKQELLNGQSNMNKRIKRELPNKGVSFTEPTKQELLNEASDIDKRTNQNLLNEAGNIGKLKQARQQIEKIDTKDVLQNIMVFMKSSIQKKSLNGMDGFANYAARKQDQLIINIIPCIQT